MPLSKQDPVELLLGCLPELVDGIEPHILASFLKDADRLTEVILRGGFRPTPHTMKNPLVRQRLVKEAQKDRAFLEMLGIMWVDSNPSLWGRIGLSSIKQIRESFDDLSSEFGPTAVRIALLQDDRQTVRNLAMRVKKEKADPQLAFVEEPEAEPPPTALPEDNQTKRLKNKIRELEAHNQKLQGFLEERNRAAEHQQSESRLARKQFADLQKELDKEHKTADRNRRSKEAADKQRSDVELALRQANKTIADMQAKEREQSPPAPVSPDWGSIISALLKKSEYQTCIAFCETVKEMGPDCLHARLVLEKAYEKIGSSAKQVDECLWIADHFDSYGQPVRGCTFALRALGIEPTRQAARVQLRRILNKINISDDTMAGQIRSLLTKLKSVSPPAYRAACKVIKQMGKQYVHALEGRPDELHPDKGFALSDGKQTVTTSIRKIVEAVDSSDLKAVHFIRRALASLKTGSPRMYRSILQNLAAYDGSCVEAITHGEKPVLVDGSNVAWDGEDKPRLRNILSLREELRRLGYFPIYVYVDAALAYQIDHSSKLQTMIEKHAVIPVDSRTAADETIIREAKRLSCPVITNDRMLEWDPLGEVTKYRFAFDGKGVTIYDG